jgi:predicted secreted protein with PEFG-CTERM motif
MDNPLEYILEIDEHIFSIPYKVNANVIAIAIDPELTSILIGLEDTSDSLFVIDLKHELISAPNNEFAILVNGLEVDYDIVSDSDSSTFTFVVPAFTEEVEIIGTHVIPEFPLGMIMGFFILIISVVVVSRTKIPIFR